ncbi:MAG: glycosyl transferase family 2 [Desulfovibrio sp.]|nr:glycosyl transferase family 2 [Desulfovibrio sp.]
MSVTALIQARMGSSRLPCKMMLSLHALPVIDWVVRRTAQSRLLTRIIAAVPDAAPDDVLASHLRALGVEVFRGPEQDVLKRFTLAADALIGAEPDALIVRVCADNPLIWGGEIDALIRYRQALGAAPDSYVYNHVPLNNLYPDGLGAEIISLGLLRLLDKKAVLPKHREHCFSYITDNADAFTIHTFDPEDVHLRRPDIKLDLDSPEDYRTLAMLPLHPDIEPLKIIEFFPEARPAGAGETCFRR